MIDVRLNGNDGVINEYDELYEKNRERFRIYENFF